MPDKSDITRLAIGYSIPRLPFLRRAASFCENPDEKESV
jgi:hypothetical protein